MDIKGTIDELEKEKEQVLQRIEKIDSAIASLVALNGVRPTTKLNVDNVQIEGEDASEPERSRKKRHYRRHKTVAWVRELSPHSIRYLKKHVTYSEFAVGVIRERKRPVTMEEIFQAYKRVYPNTTRETRGNMQTSMLSVSGKRAGLTHTTIKVEGTGFKQQIWDVDNAIALQTTPTEHKPVVTQVLNP